LQLSPHNTVAIGDAENDHTFLWASECGVAVANALPAVQEKADVVTRGDHGAGVVELIEQLLRDDLSRYDERLVRSSLSVGVRKKGGADEGKSEVRIVPNRSSVLVAGASASGKSSAVAAILEECEERGYQFCLIDPEGDFEGLAGAMVVGSASEQPEAKIGQQGSGVAAKPGCQLDERAAARAAGSVCGPAAAHSGNPRQNRSAALAGGRRGASSAAYHLVTGL
jgi:hypothetical protein